MQKSIGSLIVTLLFLNACAAKRPALYPNETLRAQGPAVSERAIDDCLSLAASYGHESNRAGRAAGGAAVGGGAGAAIGAAVGAVSGNAGTGAAYGAAYGGSSGLLGGLFSGREPDPVQRQFVDRCLRDKGYEPIGWK
jgi:outer membrane lipoprotein SlyB